jgi:hypothetical protein
VVSTNSVDSLIGAAGYIRHCSVVATVVAMHAADIRSI